MRDWFDRNTFWVVLFLACLICGALAYSKLDQLASGERAGYEEEKPQPVQVVYSKSPQDSPVSVSVIPPLNHSLQKQASLGLLWTNSSDDDIQLNVLNSERGVSNTNGGHCDVKNLLPNAATQHVSAHKSLWMPQPLDPDCFQGGQRIILDYAGTVLANKPGKGKPAMPSFEGHVYTSPLSFLTEGDRKRERWFVFILGALKLLIIPVLLGAASLFIKHQWDQREKRAEDRQAEQRTEDEIQAASREARNSVLRELISGYSLLVTNHYSQIVRRQGAVLVKYGGLSPFPGPVECDELFVAIALSRLHVMALLKNRGAIFFRSKDGEELYVTAINTFFMRMREVCGGEKQFEEAAQSFDLEDQLYQAIEKVSRWRASGNFPVRFDPSVLAKFTAWVNGNPNTFRVCIELFRLSNSVMEFEIDRPYYQTFPAKGAGSRGGPVTASGWYFDPPKLELNKEGMKLLDKEVPEIGIRNLLKAYLGGILSECKPGLAEMEA